MTRSIVSRLRSLTDALGAAVRAPELDLDELFRLLALREPLLAAVPASGTDQERRTYRDLLEEIQAVDAELRGILEERLAQVRQDLRGLTGHVRSPSRGQAASSILDRQV